jgi:hypothetical protein
MLLPVAPFAPVPYYLLALGADSVLVDVHEHFVKQTLRSRYTILSANGPLTLSIPLHRSNHMAVADVRLDFTRKWQRGHLRALDSAYMRSPFYEHYRPHIADVLTSSETLVQLFEASWYFAKRVVSLPDLVYSSRFEPFGHGDLRQMLNDVALLPPNPTYHQVFEDRFGFVPHLSILDMICNAGPETAALLQPVAKTYCPLA